MNPRDALLARLVAEQHNGGGWRPTHEPDETAHDDDLAAARRRRQMADDFDRLNAAEREAR